jgi:hypothetical protein
MLVEINETIIGRSVYSTHKVCTFEKALIGYGLDNRELFENKKKFSNEPRIIVIEYAKVYKEGQVFYVDEDKDAYLEQEIFLTEKECQAYCTYLNENMVC